MTGLLSDFTVELARCCHHCCCFHTMNSHGVGLLLLLLRPSVQSFACGSTRTGWG
jgi:hypothetical protein